VPSRILAIAGGTASGKSTLSDAVVSALGAMATRVHHDRYYRAPPPEADPASWNFDHPDALETALMVDHVRALRDGHAADVPRYDFTTHARQATMERLDPRPVVVVEGILVLAEPAVRDLADLSVFVDAPADIRLARRLRRDVAERGREPLQVLDRYLSMVRPMHEAWVAPSRAHADLVLDGTRPIEELVGAVLDTLARRGLLPG